MSTWLLPSVYLPPQSSENIDPSYTTVDGYQMVPFEFVDYQMVNPSVAFPASPTKYYERMRLLPTTTAGTAPQAIAGTAIPPLSTSDVIPLKAAQPITAISCPSAFPGVRPVSAITVATSSAAVSTPTVSIQAAAQARPGHEDFHKKMVEASMPLTTNTLQTSTIYSSAPGHGAQTSLAMSIPAMTSVSGSLVNSLASSTATSTASTGNNISADLVSASNALIPVTTAVNTRAPIKDGRYRCSSCPYTTNKDWHLKQHEASHSGEKPFTCDVCGACFNRKGNLKRHRSIVHDGIRYPCPICDKRLTTEAHLRAHLNKHNGFKPYKCNYCEATFYRSDKCRQHERKTHLKSGMLMVADGQPQQHEVAGN